MAGNVSTDFPGSAGHHLKYQRGEHPYSFIKIKIVQLVYESGCTNLSANDPPGHQCTSGAALQPRAEPQTSPDAGQQAPAQLTFETLFKAS